MPRIGSVSLSQHIIKISKKTNKDDTGTILPLFNIFFISFFIIKRYLFIIFFLKKSGEGLFMLCRVCRSIFMWGKQVPNPIGVKVYTIRIGVCCSNVVKLQEFKYLSSPSLPDI